jgi:hypothetical protein
MLFEPEEPEKRGFLKNLTSIFYFSGAVLCWLSILLPGYAASSHNSINWSMEAFRFIKETLATDGVLGADKQVTTDFVFNVLWFLTPYAVILAGLAMFVASMAKTELMECIALFFDFVFGVIGVIGIVSVAYYEVAIQDIDVLFGFGGFVMLLVVIFTAIIPEGKYEEIRIRKSFS